MQGSGLGNQLVRRDGGMVPVRISGLLTRDPHTNTEYFAGYVEDMTQQSALEQQVRQVQKLEAVGRLAGGMAHDFNNILVVIKLSTELMLAQTTPDNPLSKPLLQSFQCGRPCRCPHPADAGTRPPADYAGARH